MKLILKKFFSLTFGIKNFTFFVDFFIDEKRRFLDDIRCTLFLASVFLKNKKNKDYRMAQLFCPYIRDAGAPDFWKFAGRALPLCARSSRARPGAKCAHLMKNGLAPGRAQDINPTLHF